VTLEWDARKAEANLRKHGVAFEDAATVFLDPLGYTMKGYLAFVSHCERGERIRIVSARRATRAECEYYEEGNGSRT
jgi:hypothetical protein